MSSPTAVRPWSPVETRPRRLRAVRATLEHVDGIHDLIAREAASGRMLPRSPEELRRCITRFRVITDRDGRVLAAAGLRTYDAGATEIIGLAVDPASRGTGLGGRLVTRLMTDARRSGVSRLFAMTLEPGFFERFGFRRGSIDQVPEKVAADCASCALRLMCAEVTMILDLPEGWRAKLT